MMTDESDDDTAESTRLDASVERRSFLQLVGASVLPLLAEGCSTDKGEAKAESMQFRGLNDPTFSTPIEVVRTERSLSILHDSEHMSVDSSLLAVLSVGDQVRVTRSADEYALYTVADFGDEQSENDVGMSLMARSRLGMGAPFSAILSTAVVAQDLTDEEAEAQGELVERLVDDGVNTGLVVLAPHGGWIELYTHLQAERITSTLAAKGVSSWICKGYRQGGGAHERWHITSTDLSPNSFPGLHAIASRGFAHCVSFHGMSFDGILVGGGAPLELRMAVRDAISAVVASAGIDVYVATPDDHYAGDSPSNVVNWLTAGGTGGIQIEQSLKAREDHWEAIADAVASVFDPLL